MRREYSVWRRCVRLDYGRLNYGMPVAENAVYNNLEIL